MDYSKLSIPFHFLQKQLLEDFVKLNQSQQDLHYFIPYLTILSNGTKKFSLLEIVSFFYKFKFLNKVNIKVSRINKRR